VLNCAEEVPKTFISHPALQKAEEEPIAFTLLPVL
jgi:hypothetical protein